MTRAVALARLIYARHAAGCCLHVVLDDGNTDDESVAHCVPFAAASEAEEPGVHHQCIELAGLLVSMTPRQRGAVRANVYGHLPPEEP